MNGAHNFLLDTNIVIALRRTTRLKLPDAIIAATAIVHELNLVTCDTNLANNSPGIQSLNPINAWSSNLIPSDFERSLMFSID